jgi:chromosome segregation ATPase
MESHVVNLTDKIQKLIDQYTLDKKKIEELETQNAQLTEENFQLFSQIEESSQISATQTDQLNALQNEFNALEAKYNDLQKMLSGFESMAEGAIKKIDSIFPLIEGGE